MLHPLYHLLPQTPEDKLNFEFTGSHWRSISDICDDAHKNGDYLTLDTIACDSWHYPKGDCIARIASDINVNALQFFAISILLLQGDPLDLRSLIESCGGHGTITVHSWIDVPVGLAQQREWLMKKHSHDLANTIIKPEHGMVLIGSGARTQSSLSSTHLLYEQLVKLRSPDELLLSHVDTVFLATTQAATDERLLPLRKVLTDERTKGRSSFDYTLSSRINEHSIDIKLYTERDIEKIQLDRDANVIFRLYQPMAPFLYPARIFKSVLNIRSCLFGSEQPVPGQVEPTLINVAVSLLLSNNPFSQLEGEQMVMNWKIEGEFDYISVLASALNQKGLRIADIVPSILS